MQALHQHLEQAEQRTAQAEQAAAQSRADVQKDLDGERARVQVGRAANKALSCNPTETVWTILRNAWSTHNTPFWHMAMSHCTSLFE